MATIGDLHDLLTYQGRPMRVLQAMAGGARGGAETFFVSLVMALHKAGLDQLAVIRRNSARRKALNECGVEVIELPFRGFADIRTVLGLRRAARRYRPDVVIGWMNRASAVLPDGPYLRLARLGGYYNLKNYRRADHLICITKDICSYVVREGWPKERVHYLPNFARTATAEPASRHALSTPEDAPVILALGRLHEVKAFDILLRALAIEARPYLWLAGAGALAGNLEALSRSLGIAERVRFLGWRDDRDALFAAADLCVMPSRHEPFGTVIIEAWAHRVPLIAAASQGPVATITDQSDGLLVPVDDAPSLAAAIGRVLDDDALRQRLVARGWRTYQEHFTEDACVERYLRTMRHLLARRDGERAARQTPAAATL